MQTRRSLTLASKSPALKPTISSVFKHSKARTSARALTSKAAAQLAETKFIETKTSALSVENDIVIVTTTTKQQTRRTRKPASPQTPMEIEPTSNSIVTSTTETSTIATKEKKPKAPEENPWTKRPLNVPSYAQEALEHLCKVDPALAPLIAKHPYTIYSDDDNNYFRVLSRTIIGQQIHWKAAKTIIFRFVSYYFPDGKVTVESLDSGDKSFPAASQVLSTPMDKLRLCGLSERKASYIQDLARHFVEGKITFTDKAMLQSMKDEEIASQLLCVKGIGPWTVDMFMMSTLERLDILPTLDLGIRKGMEKHFKKDYKNGVWGQVVEEVTVKKIGAKGKGKVKNGEMTCSDMERMAERWRPYRSIASWYMWRNAEGTVTAPI
ncbi:3-methyladenine DNA glycosylase [Mortierella sp. AD094]|nr:3-methyladenine DNA glycosylase [Mortierella sp. AD094]